MFRGFYTAAAGMLTQQRHAEMLANNIANANTPGYKADRSAMRAFPEMLLARIEKHNGAPQIAQIGSVNTGAYMQELIPQFTQGDIHATDLPTDVALVEENVPYHEETNLKGALFFAVQTPEGEVKYTRNGHFTIDNEGRLMMAGNYVLSTNGTPIVITGNDFTITPEGDVFENGIDTGQTIDIRLAADVRNLINEGNGLFRTADGTVLASAVGNGNVQYTLRQGFLERSNVDVARAYTDMMTAYRTFEANQKVLQAYDRSMDKAVNEIGRIG